MGPSEEQRAIGIDAELVGLLCDVMTMGTFTVKLNHRKLLDAMLAIAGVPAQRFRPICRYALQTQVIDTSVGV
jgi:histidyl-tRNA synthetase